MSDFKNILESLNNGIVPPELLYNNEIVESIDWSKVKYNAFYKSNAFFESKFPDGFQNISGFDRIIESIRENVKTPLEEMIERQNIKQNIDEENVEMNNIINGLDESTITSNNE